MLPQPLPTLGADGRVVFRIPISEFYPLAQRLVIEALDSGAAPYESLWSLYTQACAMGREAFEMVTVPRSQCPPAAAALRAQALELCRLWLTEALHQSINQRPMRLILEADDLEFRL